MELFRSRCFHSPFVGESKCMTQEMHFGGGAGYLFSPHASSNGLSPCFRLLPHKGGAINRKAYGS